MLDFIPVTLSPSPVETLSKSNLSFQAHFKSHFLHEDIPIYPKPMLPLNSICTVYLLVLSHVTLLISDSGHFLALLKSKIIFFWLKTLRVKQAKPDNIRLERKWGLTWPLQSMGCGTVWYIRTRTQRVARFLLPSLCRFSPGLRFYLSFPGTGSRIWNLGLKACGDNCEEKRSRLRKMSITLTKDSV